MKFNLEYIFLALILIFGLFIRVYGLDSAPLWVDEATSSMAAKEILEKGAPVFDSGLFYSRALFFHYSQSFFLLFGINDFNARIVSVIFGLATIFLAFLIGREYSKTGGIISALFMSLFYLEVFFSRQARFYQLFQLMFFLSLYLLYKSRENKKYLYWSFLTLLITIDTHIAGIVLTPFFIGFILLYHKPKWLAAIPGVMLLWKLIDAYSVSARGSGESFINAYFERYSSYLGNIHYMLIFFIPGLIWSYFKKKLLTLLLIIPSLILLVGLLTIQTFAFRYMYFFIFVLVLYSSLLISYLLEKYGKIFYIALIALIVIPSNLFFPATGTIILEPISTNFHDASAPYTNYKDLDLPENITLVSFFSSDVEWYLRKPDYVIPFSMDGVGYDQISWNSSNGLVDRYSGALIFDYNLTNFYLTADAFSVSKLKGYQRTEFNNLISNCSIYYSARDLIVYRC